MQEKVTPASDYISYIAELPQEDQWVIKEFRSTDEGRPVVEAVIKREAVAVSDGSSKDQKGTLATTLVGNSKSKAIISSNKVSCNKWEQGAHRSELARVLASITHKKVKCKK